ncbi:hypothetical protein FRC02_004999 [Tulasnella sp. 418]|nr:hypothetical protein FRC02_004999 [Tulasnella sp. 418]
MLTAEDLISRCYSYIYSEHSLDQLHYPSQKSDENVFEFLHSLKNTPSNNTGAQEQPDIRTHMLCLKISSAPTISTDYGMNSDDGGNSKAITYIMPVKFS